MTVAYCTKSQLYVEGGGMSFDSTLDFQRFIDSAAVEMNGKLGVIYEIPLAPAIIPPATVAPATLPEYQLDLLQTINAKLASGRIMLTIDSTGEGSRQHAYGAQLVREAMMELMYLVNGEVDIAAVRRPSQTTNSGPRILNHDAESSVDVYEKMVHNRDRVFAWPGKQDNIVHHSPTYYPIERDGF